MKSLGLLLIAFLFFTNASYTQHTDSIVADSARKPDYWGNDVKAVDTNVEDSLVTIVGVGDIMLGTNFPDISYLPPFDGQHLLDSVKEQLLHADVTFGNLEGTYLDTGGQVKKCNNPKLCYAFRSPSHYLTYIKDAGFDLLSLANNHSGDFGPEGRNNTQRTLDTLNLHYSGLFECPMSIFVKDGIRYGFASFAPNSGCLNINNLGKAIEIVKKLDSLSDIIIISFHGGAEGSKYQHVVEGMEKYVGEDRGDLRLFTHAVIDAGADVVFGHGPHVTRAIELYKGRMIAYSLGNFATYGRFNLSGPNGVCPILKLQVNRQGEFISGEIIPIKQIGEGIPRIDPEKKVIGIMQYLTKTDFPDTPIIITDDGKIKRF